MHPNKESGVYRNRTFNKMGHGTGRTYLESIQQLLHNRNQDTLYRLDAPTESKGNCYPYALMQGLHRPEIYTTLSDEMKELCENYHDLRVAIVEFVKYITPASEYFTIIDDSRANYAELQINDPSLPTWDEVIENMKTDGVWFEAQFVRFSACFIRRDVIIHTSTQDLKFCGSPNVTEGDDRVDHDCNCQLPPIHIASIRNIHFQSILPIQNPSQESTNQNEADKSSEKTKMHRCNICDFSTPRAYNMKRHQTTHPKNQDQIKEKAASDEPSHRNETTPSITYAKDTLNSLVKKFICNICGLDFAQPQYLSRHIKVEHEQIYDDRSNKENLSQKFQCLSCEKSYKDN